MWTLTNIIKYKKQKLKSIVEFLFPLSIQCV